jgi:hypothetical protein
MEGWPAATAGVGKQVTLEDLLTVRFGTDAHFSQYFAPGHPWRLLHDAYKQLPTPPSVGLIVFDADCEEAHRTKTPAPETWFELERPKLIRLNTDMPGCFVYRTAGGYRIVYRLRRSAVIDSSDAELAWRLYYVLSCVYLARTYEIIADPTCKSWAWIFRAPHATRSREFGPEERECIGDPQNVGWWSYVPR